MQDTREPFKKGNIRRFSLKTVVGIVFLAVISSMAVTLIAAWFWLFPSSIKPVNLNPEEQAVLEAKLSVLKEPEANAPQRITGPDVQEYAEHPEDRIIYFTQRELNAMIAGNPDLADRVFLHLSEDLISAAMLVTLPQDFPVLAGRTIRISTGIHVDYHHGKPRIALQGVSIMGVPLPNAWLGNIKGKNLALLDENNQQGFWHVFSQGVRDLKVEQGRLRVELAD